MTGFGARSFAYRHNEDLGLPRKPADWSEEDILYANSLRGEDRSGNLLIGEESLARYFETSRNVAPALDLNSRSWKYPQLAQKTLAGELPAAQFGGEQPKFTICVDDQGSPCHMIIKFSPAVDSKEAERYADLLVCEHLSLEAIRFAGFTAARSRLVIAGVDCERLHTRNAHDRICAKGDRRAGV